MGATLFAVSTPSYWLALMLMLAFSLWLGLLPSIGVGTPAHYVLPWRPSAGSRPAWWPA